MAIRVLLDARAQREEAKLDPQVRRRVRRALQRLATGDQRNVRQLKQHPVGTHRLRVGKDWRVIFYRLEDGSIVVARIRHRRHAY